MPPEPLPFDRKDFLKDKKPSSLDPLGIVQPRWRDPPPTTPSQHNNRGFSSSCRWGSGGGPSDFRRPFSGLHGKRVGSGWHNTTVESGSKENSCITNSVSMPFGSQKDPKAGVNSWKTTASASASPNGNSLLHNDQLQSVDQHAKNSGGGFSTTNSQRLEKENSLASSLDWKPVKWIRSGSLSSRDSGFSHSSGCKIIGVDPLNTSSPLRSPSEDASLCVTPNTPDEANSCKKRRLGWGEGLAKYEKKKVDPDDIVDREAGVRNGIVVGVSASEPLLTNTSPYNMSDKSPSVNGYSECASPTTPYSFACSSSTGLEEKESTKTVTVDTSVASCHLSENHTEQLSSNLENLEHNLSFSIDELLQTDDSRSPGSGFVKSTAMEKLQVWKAELTRTLEITETEIDSLENELKSLVSDGGSCVPPASDSLLTESNHKTSEETCGPLPVEKTDSSPEGLNGVDDDSDGKSPGTTSKFVNCSAEVGNDDMLGFVASCGDGNEVPTGSSSTDSDGEDADNGREDNNKLYGMIVATNKAIADRASDELSRLLLPTTHLCTNISKATDESSNKIKFSSRKRFLKFKERVITCKFRALQYSWKEELHSLSLKKVGAKSQKKPESSSRMGYSDHQKCRSPGGSLTLVPTTETLDYVKKLLSDSRVKVQHKKALKMPCLILDRSERMMTRFISDNGLVENPIDIEKERSIVNPWTEKEQEVFLEKYSQFGKDFKKIASFLESRSIGDCVEFYYKNHKSDCFQKAKKNSKFAKGKSCSTTTTNTYLVTSGRRMNNEGVAGAGATSLEMLGAASAMVANVDSQQKNYHVGISNDQRLLPSEVLNDFAMSCNEQETAAADVLAGICGSISSEALGSCITSSVDHGDVHHHHHHGRRSLKLDGNDVDEEDTCSGDSCDEDMDASYWTDEEKLRFIKAFRSHGKDFSKISRSMRTKTSDQCRVFFSKARKCLGLDVNDAEGASEGNNESDDEDAFMVENDGSDISHDKSSLECSKMDDLVENNINAGVGERRSSNGCDSSASCPKVEGKVSRDLLTTCPVEDLNKASLGLDSSFDDDGNGGGVKLSGSEKAVADSGFLMMSNFFPGDSSGGVVEEKDRKKSLSPCSQDDVSSKRLSFRKSCDNKNNMYERCSNLLPKHSLLDSSQILRGYPVIEENKLKLEKNLLITSADVEKEKEKASRSGGGGVKLFGQILTKRPQESSVVVNDKKAASASASSLNVDHSNNVTIRSPHGYWDGKKIQMQMQMGIPDSERLLAKYPAAFSKTSAFLSFDRNHQFRASTSLRMVSGFQACSSNGVEGFTVDKLLLPRKVSDPVAAIRRHYANRGEEYKSDI